MICANLRFIFLRVLCVSVVKSVLAANVVLLQAPVKGAPA
jgi:hypothetical protein